MCRACCVEACASYDSGFDRKVRSWHNEYSIWACVNAGHSVSGVVVLVVARFGRCTIYHKAQDIRLLCCANMVGAKELAVAFWIFDRCPSISRTVLRAIYSRC